VFSAITGKNRINSTKILFNVFRDYHATSDYRVSNFRADTSNRNGGTTRPLSRDEGAEEFRGDPTVGPRPSPRVLTRRQK